MKDFDKIIRLNNIKLKARYFYCKYGYAISELVLNDIISNIKIANKSEIHYYNEVRKRINKQGV